MDDDESQQSQDACYWPSRCSASSKGLMIGLLLLCFVLQTFLVYTDNSTPVKLDPTASAGRRLWHQNNCQSCHQLHGFGGFLGPDLTNAIHRIEPEQLAARLRSGEGPMPTFEMNDEQVVELWSFLYAMDETGYGQARHPSVVRVSGSSDQQPPFNIALESMIAEAGDLQVTQGFELFRTGTCKACHRLGQVSSIGAPDLTLTADRLSNDEIFEVLINGRPPTMPPTNLSEAQREEMRAFLVFLNEHRAQTLERMESTGEDESFWSSVPWWEF